MEKQYYIWQEFFKTQNQFAIVNLLDNQLVHSARSAVNAGAWFDICIDVFNRDNDCLVIIDKLHPERHFLSLEEFALCYGVSLPQIFNRERYFTCSPTFVIPER